MVELTLMDDEGLAFPPTCACCLTETSDTRVTYKHKLEVGFGDPQAKTKKLHVPCCRSCKAHIDWSTGGGYLGVLLSIVVNLFLFGMLAGLLYFVWTMASDWAYEHPEAAGWILGMGAVATVAGLASRRLSARHATTRLRGRHARQKESVEIVGFDSDGRVRLRIYNPEWARALSERNARSLAPAAS